MVELGGRARRRAAAGMPVSACDSSRHGHRTRNRAGSTSCAASATIANRAAGCWWWERDSYFRPDCVVAIADGGRRESITWRSAVTEPMVPRRPRRFMLIGLALVLVPLLLFSLYAGLTLQWSYSTGVRAGILQKFSDKGWICK